MEKQVIISISREYGSGGHYIARRLAERFGLPLYDHTMLDRMVEERGIDVSHLKKYETGMRMPFWHKVPHAPASSPEETVAAMQFDFLYDRAAAGESFVVVGRCSESVLREFPGLITIFVSGDREAKIKRVMTERSFSRAEAEAAMLRHDQSRKAYHNYYSGMKWGDSRNYELCVNSSKLGINKIIDMLEIYIKERMK